MSAMASHITGVSIGCTAVCSGADQRKQLCVTGLCEGISPVTGELPAERSSNAENVSIWWRHHGLTLVQVMACCLPAPSHFLNGYGLFINQDLCHSLERKFRIKAQTTILLNDFEYNTSPSGQWVNTGDAKPVPCGHWSSGSIPPMICQI